MPTLQHWFATTEEEVHRLEAIGAIADRHAAGAKKSDDTNQLNIDLIDDLKKAGYHTNAVPKEFGGQGASLREILLYQERIAQVDAAAALAIGWHQITMHDLSYNQLWGPNTFRELCRSVVECGALINRADSEAATGSPTRGGKPQTTAEQAGEGFVLNGRKAFTSLSTALSYVIVSASDEETGSISDFLIPINTEGVRIDPTWNMIGMRGTASHDLVLDDVRLPASARVIKGIPGKPKGPLNFTLLHIPACYLGIAIAASKEAVSFASRYQPNSLNHPIIQLPHIRQKIGQIELELSAARHYLYSVADRWDRQTEFSPEERRFVSPDIAAVKVFVIQNALSVVDKAMRVVGVHSLAQDHLLQRLYRDVRFGLHNPMAEDHTLEMLAARAIEDINE
ncbi:acyl-CoA dehydrogenase family protein [Paenibacillus sp. ISL-20]|uniref:acyl-CoA dehydrogenase family protein n=1 Tax=Paenibacillus sp. ISL-20 TaxID=2819163 RepID=UPI001BE5DD79|nr:acyl-CoA dehydrogenase family protein [Paenibacillus sp. ISL-20]MBT2760300.1 acyl-CoA/acyl-ACP dehydrogenase [Paenibacillus sp. ISL-20]